MTEVRSPQNRTMNYTGVVHYATDGKPACGTPTPGRWNRPTVATVTCAKCIAKYGADTPGQVDPPAPVDENIARRAAERAARQAARSAS